MASHAATTASLDHHDEEHPPPIYWSAATPINRIGMLFFIGSEIALFGSFFMSYLFLRVAGVADYSSWAHQIGSLLPLKIVTINSLVLFSSSVTIHYAEIALTRGARRWQAFWLCATIALGAIFFSVQVFEFKDLLLNEYIGPSTSSYSSVFFSITGLHATHVIVGLILLTVLLVRTLRGHYSPEPSKHVGFSTMAIYWHFVDVVWIFVFSLIYLPGNLDRWGHTNVLGIAGYGTFFIGIAIIIFLLNAPKLVGKGFAKTH
ncbi:MAG: heme-copper oxidase subunit III [Gaiellales bacterium]